MYLITCLPPGDLGSFGVGWMNGICGHVISQVKIRKRISGEVNSCIAVYASCSLFWAMGIPPARLPSLYNPPGGIMEEINAYMTVCLFQYSLPLVPLNHQYRTSPYSLRLFFPPTKSLTLEKFTQPALCHSDGWARWKFLCQPTFIFFVGGGGYSCWSSPG